MYPELRSAPRVSCQARFLGATSSVLRGAVTDLSPAGLCLVVAEALERGRELHLEFELPHGAVSAVGEVRRVTRRRDGRHEVGIRFARISADAQAVLALAAAPAESRSIS